MIHCALGIQEVESAVCFGFALEPKQTNVFQAAPETSGGLFSCRTYYHDIMDMRENLQEALLVGVQNALAIQALSWRRLVEEEKQSMWDKCWTFTWMVRVLYAWLGMLRGQKNV